MRPRTDNSIEQGSGNTQIGHNTGEVHVGLTFEQHQQALQEALADKTADLERAHGAEKDLLRRETDELRRRLSEVETDYQDRLEELATLKADLSKFENRFEKEKFDAANAALDRDDTSLAEALFKELLKAAEARREDAEQDEAGLHFRLGKIAEAEVRWHDAYTHYKRAAELTPGYDTLFKARLYAWRAGQFDAAHRCGADLVEFARNEGTQKQIASALHEHAVTLRAQGQYPEAERLFREALEIERKTIGEAHPDYATNLNNLAAVMQAQGRYPEAEGLYREALEIDSNTIGTAHPDYANHLNNLAGVVEDQGRLDEAEGLYREALEIGRKTIGEAHPTYATRLNNLAGVVGDQGRLDEAEPLHREALEITRKTLGAAHPDYAVRLGNLAAVMQAQGRYPEAEGLYREALEIDSNTIGTAHPDYAKRLNNLGGVVEAQGRVEKAEPLYREALEITRKALGEAHPDFAIRLVNLGSLLGQTGRMAEGRDMLEQALAIFRAALPPEHPHIATAHRWLAALPDP